jgi:hypothetical protein
LHGWKAVRAPLLLVALVAGLGLAGCREREKRAAPEPPPDAQARPSLRATDGIARWEIPDGPFVERVAARLRELGVYRGPADGTFRPALEGALREFQAARGLPATGALDPPTADALGVRFAEARERPRADQPAPDAGVSRAPAQPPHPVSGHDGPPDAGAPTGKVPSPGI